MNKKIILITGILLLLAITGCNKFGKGGQTPISDADLRKGMDGLKMEFLSNAPPEKVFAESGFPISLKLKNAGASDVEDGSGIVVFGFEKAYVNVPQERVSFSVKGKSVYAPLGEDEFITINARTGAIGTQSEEHPSSIFATACYPYKTVLGASVCVDPDITGQRRGQKACTVKDLAFTEGQGAPVSVTKVEARILPQDNGRIKPHFLIHVKNAGNGEVIDLGKVESVCTSEALNYKDFNTLVVKASLSGVALKCNANEESESVTVRLRDKEDLIRCTYEKDDGIDSGVDAYAAPLKVELDYGYTFTISKSIIIEKVLTH
ncbi:hypothetical protein HYW19_03655 [Candidatus Woesearchaeota archaeon]|nr:hypothetical protein [Candidatus Woesearchaeota archaeon]